MTEDLILNHLILNEQYNRKTIAFLKPEYFSEQSDKTLFNLISDYTLKYNAIPTKEALLIDLSNLDGISEDAFQNINVKIKDASIDEQTNLNFILNKTEEFCKEKAIYNAILESISIIDKKGKDLRGPGAIPQILSEALAVSFDTSIGHDYLEDYEARYDFYHNREEKIPFDIEYLNKITKGGLPRKTLSVLMSSTSGAGKSLCMCHFAASNLAAGLNVLYITMELSEEMVSKRIDANLMNVTLDELEALPHKSFTAKAERNKEKYKGKLIVKEYPTGSAHSGHFRHLLNELKIKKNFIPDVIYIDYLNICSSSRVKMSGSMNTYTYVKTIAEEIRGLAIEFNAVIISATQGNREAIKSSDPGPENVSESIGIFATVDVMLAIITNEELEELGQLLFKQLKNRFGPLDKFRRFVVGVARDRMKLFDLNESAQKSFRNEKDTEEPIMDKTTFGKESSKRDFTNFQ